MFCRATFESPVVSSFFLSPPVSSHIFPPGRSETKHFISEICSSLRFIYKACYYNCVKEELFTFSISSVFLIDLPQAQTTFVTIMRRRLFLSYRWEEGGLFRTSAGIVDGILRWSVSTVSPMTALDPCGSLPHVLRFRLNRVCA